MNETHATAGPRPGPGAEPELPAGFLPLRLVLQPSGLTVELNRPNVLVGRHTGADVRLPLPDVSRRHCRFVWNESGWEVIDLNSLNGVYVNGVSVRQGTIHPGDILKIGGFHFLVMRGDGDTTEEAGKFVRDLFRSQSLPATRIEPPHRKAS